jgi:glucose-1-phosphate adenylyltransferase
VLILAGDHVYKMDYRKMIAFHRMMKADATVGVVRVPIEETHRFGTVKVDAANRIKEFVEKSSNSQSNIASMGIYVFNKDLLARCLGEDAEEIYQAEFKRVSHKFTHMRYHSFLMYFGVLKRLE